MRYYNAEHTVVRSKGCVTPFSYGTCMRITNMRLSTAEQQLLKEEARKEAVTDRGMQALMGIIANPFSEGLDVSSKAQHRMNALAD